MRTGDSVLRQTAFVAFALVVSIATSWWDPPAASVARAACGDGILDPDYELCDHGAANGTDGCCTEFCTLIDDDADGACDAEDPCASPGPLLADATILVKGFVTPEPDDSFQLTGTLAPGAVFDPAVSDITILLSNQFYGTVVRGVIPGGAGWRPGPRGGWSYRDPAGTHGGVVRVILKPLAGGALAVTVKGRRRDYARTTDLPPFRASMAIVASGGGVPQCSETMLSRSRCSFAVSGNTLRCSPPPAQRRCGGSIDSLVRCAARNGAAAQESHFTAQGTYFSGACGELPEFELPPDVVCTTIGNDLSFALVTTSPFASGACVYESAPSAGDPNLICD